jgi:ketosteroid isomerase-like protein
VNRHSIIAVALLVCFGTAAAAKSPQAEISAKDVAAIKAQIDRYVRTALAADFEAWGRTLATDVVVMPPNQSPVVGRTAAVAWGNTFPRLTSLTVNADEIKGRGDLAYATGTYALSGTLTNGTTFSEKGSFLEIHRRAADGSWPYTHVIWHADAPPPSK